MVEERERMAVLEYWIRSTWDGGKPADGAEIKLTISSLPSSSSSSSSPPAEDEEEKEETRKERGNNKVTDDDEEKKYNNNALGHGGGSTGLMIQVDAPFYDDPQVPTNIPVGSTDQLWNYEVVELFFLATDNKYLEIELAPKGHYLLLQLDGHPEKRLQYELPLANYQTEMQGNGRWLGQAIIPYNYFPSVSSSSSSGSGSGIINRFNAYAIHKSGPNRRYMALYPVPKGKYNEPNFHRLEYFQPIDLSQFLI